MRRSADKEVPLYGDRNEGVSEIRSYERDGELMTEETRAVPGGMPTPERRRCAWRRTGYADGHVRDGFCGRVMERERKVPYRNLPLAAYVWRSPTRDCM